MAGLYVTITVSALCQRFEISNGSGACRGFGQAIQYQEQH